MKEEAMTSIRSYRRRQADPPEAHHPTLPDSAAT
jgi:hypothetical protein